MLLWEKAQAKERSKFKSEGDAHVTGDSSTVAGVKEQVRRVANATAAFDCCIDCIASLKVYSVIKYLFIFYWFCLFFSPPCILGLPTANSLYVPIIYVAVWFTMESAVIWTFCVRNAYVFIKWQYLHALELAESVMFVFLEAALVWI